MAIPGAPMTPEQHPPAGARAIVLTKGWVAWVDAESYPELATKSWCALFKGQHVSAVRGERREGKSRVISMHRQLFGPTAAREIDHHKRLDGIKVIDNRRANLRAADRSLNAANTQMRPRFAACPQSPFKGVSWSSPRRKWRARLKADILGYFDHDAHAALLYDAAAVREYGEFAYTNFPVPGSSRAAFV